MDFIDEGNKCYSQGNFEGAIDWYEKAINKTPNDVSAHTNKGLALEELKRYQEALDSVDVWFLDIAKLRKWVFDGVKDW